MRMPYRLLPLAFLIYPVMVSLAQFAPILPGGGGSGWSSPSWSNQPGGFEQSEFGADTSPASDPAILLDSAFDEFIEGFKLIDEVGASRGEERPVLQRDSEATL